MTPEDLHQAIRPIVLGVSAYWGVTVDEIFGSQHVRHIVRARHACYWLARRDIPNVSYPALARMFRRADHTAIMYGCKRIDELVFQDDRAIMALVDWASGKKAAE